MPDQAQPHRGQGTVTSITSLDNPVLKELRRLAHENTAYRKQGRFWVEGDHLCRAALTRGQKPDMAIFSESGWPPGPGFTLPDATKSIVIPDRLFKGLSSLESPASMGFVFNFPPVQPIQADAMTVILDRVQDAGNVGSILRSAAAFGFRQVLSLEGTAALWSPKVLRAGMGAHFGLNLREGLALDDLDVLQIPILATSSHAGQYVHHQALPVPCAWVMGHEGQGVCTELLARAAHTVRIAQPGGEESLNVAAAAAICLHASSTNTPFKL